MDNTISNKQLLELAHNHGYPVSATQLARWHRAGILPRPQQQALGKGQGTQSLYPGRAGEQLLRLCELHKHERRLTQLAWQIWWESYPVDIQHIREFLERTTAQLSERIRLFVAIKALEQTSDENLAEESEQPLSFIERFALADLDYKPLRRIRKRLGKEQFATFIRMLTDIASGTFKSYSTAYDRREVLAELRILARGLGQDKFFIKDNANLEHYIENILIPHMQKISLWLQTLPWEQALQNATTFDLQQARDEIRFMSTNFRQNKDATPQKQVLPRDYPLWGNALDMILPTVTIEEQATLLVMYVTFNASGRADHDTST